jgi:hypothetical protein
MVVAEQLPRHAEELPVEPRHLAEIARHPHVESQVDHGHDGATSMPGRSKACSYYYAAQRRTTMPRSTTAVGCSFPLLTCLCGGGFYRGARNRRWFCGRRRTLAYKQILESRAETKVRFSILRRRAG